jgi:hypothetical protein
MNKLFIVVFCRHCHPIVTALSLPPPFLSYPLPLMRWSWPWSLAAVVVVVVVVSWYEKMLS